MGGTFHAPLGQALTDLSGVAGSLLIYVGWIMRWVQPQGLQAKRAVEDCDIHYSGASFLLKQLLLNPLVGSKQAKNMSIYVYISLYVYMSMCVCVYVHVCVLYMYMYLYLYLYLYLYMYMYI